MFITLSNTTSPATDLGYLLHKHPDKVQRFTQTFGEATVFYPQVDDQRCTVALLVDVDPIRLVRGLQQNGDGPLAQYVNDRPYAASSFLAVALNAVFRSAFSGSCKDRPELLDKVMSLEITLPALPCRGGEFLLRQLFEPLGYQVTATRLPFDSEHPEWGDSPYFSVELTTHSTLAPVLKQLAVLLPVLDNSKHYWASSDEVEKLLRHGGDWLPNHPSKELVARRYLRHQKSLMRQALERLVAGDEIDDPQVETAEAALPAEIVEEKALPLNQQRIDAVLAKLRELGATQIVDVGCGEGRLLKELAKEKSVARIVGMDVSSRTLEIAAARLDRLPPRQRSRVTLIQGSLIYRDRRLQGFDVATCIEVIEHLDPSRLTTFSRTLFEFARPGAVILTTPNREYNALYPNLPADTLRHSDHRFEWTRNEFSEWANQIAHHHGYQVQFSSIGDEDPIYGAATQMALFTRLDALISEKPQQP